MIDRLNMVRSWLREWSTRWINGWNQFWFSPELPHVLAVIRIGCGLMIAYMHIVWLSHVDDFFGPNAWITADASRTLHSGDWGWSWLWYTESPLIAGIHLGLTILAGIMMAAGLLTRFSVPVALLLTLMVIHRQTLATFGLDQIVVMLALYLAICRSGSVWSIDAWLRDRGSDGKHQSVAAAESWLFPTAKAATSNRIATRLIQLHLCVIYIFGGLSKMRGEMWFDGSALWYTIVNYEYQSMDLTWLGRSRVAIASLTAITIFWETFYCALVWPKLTRPLAIALAILVHGGIALGLGMITFGFIMILANFAFVSPQFMKRLQKPES